MAAACPPDAQMALHAGSHSDRAPGRIPARDRVLVREAAVDDLDLLVTMRLALLADEARSASFVEAHPDAVSRARRLTAQQFRAPHQVFFVCFVGRAPAGMLRCGLTMGSPLQRHTTRGMLTAAYVVPRFRCRGVLRRLVAAAGAWSAARGVNDLRLHCLTANAAGNAAWEALGFEVVEVVRRRYGTG